MTAYYNEIDTYAAAWLRNLIDAGHIANGVVDERSIEDICPRDLDGFKQCHFFAGIGVWSYALRAAGWPDDRPVWTGSCPCQPFSAAGKGSGFDDERHLWPAWHHLIRECKPAVILGEQVASKDAEPWLDLVQDDLEGLGHAFGAIPFPAAGVGAPHIRDRLYWVASREHGLLATGGGAGQLGHANEGRSGRHAGAVLGAQGGVGRGVRGVADGAESAGAAGEFADNGGSRLEGRDARAVGHECATVERGGATRGFWANAEWIACRDGKARPVEPGTFPLAHGAPARVGRLRAYGNGLCAPAAEIYIECVMECMP